MLTDGVVQLILGLFTLVGIVTIGWWQFGRTTQTVRETQETIGSIDHDDAAELTVVEMLREILKGQTHQDIRIAAAESKLSKHHDRLTTHAERLDAQGHRIDLHGHRIDALEKTRRLQNGEA